ncbi:MAG: single-stranded-DNA-specific exonuclease RecJ [Gammaproteobacteria bacterium]|nr:single-stranded-DNA-specific exonuclease RecJ [Gammaproteobacteria bacterium]
MLPAARREIRRRAMAGAATLPGHLHPVLRRLYAARGVGDADELDLDLRRLLPVSTLDGIEAAAGVVCDHLRRGSRLLVVGDFDADGATSTALVLRQLQRLGHANAAFRVPDRLRHGYGLTPELVADFGEERPDLLITVDNGVAAHAGIGAARSLGIPVLVTDHHLPGAGLPAAAAIVNPNLPGAGFGSHALAGVGVAFYLMAAVTRALENERGVRLPPVADLLDLVALGTIADLVPLDRNNRILVREGLRRIRAGRACPGLLALAGVAGIGMADISTRTLGFQIAPRLNAAGRIDDMAVGIRCLLVDDTQAAAALAAELDTINRERRELEARMQQEASAAVRKLHLQEGALPAGLALYDAGWHPGIVGLIATRVRERVHRPVVAFAPAADGELRGSARSVDGLHIRDALEAIAVREPDLIGRFGGHAMAAGLSLRRDRLARFATAFAAEIGGLLAPERMRGVIETDGALEPAEMSLETALAIESGGPWGQGFPEPLFDNEFEVLEARVVGERHLKLLLRAAPATRPIEAIAFGQAERSRRPQPGARIVLCYRLQASRWGGNARAELSSEYLEVLD